VADHDAQTLLIFDTATVVLEMGRAGKFHAKAKRLGGKPDHSRRPKDRDLDPDGR
jgi:hypothetical protein